MNPYKNLLLHFLPGFFRKNFTSTDAQASVFFCSFHISAFLMLD